jgi:L-lactate utilization protein LutB
MLLECTIETCALEAAVPVSITNSGNYNEMLCLRCGACWRASPDFKLAEQLVGMGLHGGALSQYQNWKAVQSARIGVA